MSKKTLVKIIVLCCIIIGIICVIAIIKNKKDKQNKDNLTAQNISSSNTVNISKDDIYIVKDYLFIKDIAISGIFKPIQEAQIKARISGEIEGLTVKIGDTVNKGQLITQIKNSDIQARINQSQAQINLSKQQLNIASNQYKRYEELAKQNFISQNGLETYKNSLDLASSNLKSAIANHQINEKSQNDSFIYAPFSGLVASKNVQNNEKVTTDLNIITLVDISSLELEAGVSDENIPLIKINQQVNLSLDKQNQQNQLIGKVVRIAPSSINNSRLVNIYIQIKNKDNIIKAGTFAKGKIILQSLTLSAVPSSSIVKQLNHKAFVYVIKNDKLIKVEVQESLQQDNLTAVNLNNGEKIIAIPLPSNIDLNNPIKIQ